MENNTRERMLAYTLATEIHMDELPYPEGLQPQVQPRYLTPIPGAGGIVLLTPFLTLSDIPLSSHRFCEMTSSLK